MDPQNILLAAGVVALLSLAFAIIKRRFIYSHDQGTDEMKKLAGAIQDGAMAFLKKEYSWLCVFVAVVALALFLGLGEDGQGLSTAICFIYGAISSAMAGFIGMRVATRSAVRTTEAAKTSLGKALTVAFSSGAVMGFTVVGLGLLGVSILTWYFQPAAGSGASSTDWIKPIFGFSFGASSIALFARVGGGIYTKAADVGADLVGKVEAGHARRRPAQPRGHRRQRRWTTSVTSPAWEPTSSSPSWAPSIGAMVLSARLHGRQGRRRGLDGPCRLLPGGASPPIGIIACIHPWHLRGEAPTMKVADPQHALDLGACWSRRAIMAMRHLLRWPT